jgi:LL-diaminopimelate aminotransferase
MARINSHFQKLRTEYIFPVIEEKLGQLKAREPHAAILNLGIGDIARPLAPSIVSAICQAVQDMGEPSGIRGYGPSEGYPFLREAIATHEYAGLNIHADEIFISDGANTDTANIGEIFGIRNVVGMQDPTYPVYLASSIMAGRSSNILFFPCTEETGFAPLPPDVRCDLVYLCSPGNPTGVAMSRTQLSAWVEYATRTGAILLYDNAYTAFITSPDVPKTIFEIEGAKEVAIEFRSFSKSAGFTGLRCAYTVLPKSVHALNGKKKHSLHALWSRRQSTKFNGVAYPIQKGAAATLAGEGKQQTSEQIASYLSQARALRTGLTSLGHTCFGGIDAPYIWWKTPRNMSSWEFFETLMNRCHLISIPGKPFGACGEGYVRLSAFTTADTTAEALKRIQNL